MEGCGLMTWVLFRLKRRVRNYEDDGDEELVMMRNGDGLLLLLLHLGGGGGKQRARVEMMKERFFLTREI